MFLGRAAVFARFDQTVPMRLIRGSCPAPMAFAIAVIVGLGTACMTTPQTTPSRSPLGKNFEVRVGQVMQIAGETLTVTFERVAEDSRCPTGVTCVWEGDATVRLVVEGPAGARATLNLHTNVNPQREASFQQYTVQLIRLIPWPKDTTGIAPEQYVATLAVIRSSGAAGQSPTSVRTGSWGGDNIGLTVTEAGARIEFACAFGEITQPLALDAGGRGRFDGTYVQERGGPVRADQEPERQPAWYAARLVGETLTLEVILTRAGTTIGSFSLTHGREPRVKKCR